MSYQFLDIDLLIDQALKRIMPSAYSLSKSELDKEMNTMTAKGDQKPLKQLEYTIDYHRRFSLSLISIIFVILGFSITLSSQKRYFKIPPVVISLVILVIYWISYVLSNFLSLKMALPGWLGLWTIVGIFSAFSLYQLYKKRLMY